jgi:2-methylisocitrate lyase-like PEP mutase family enzyme
MAESMGLPDVGIVTVDEVAFFVRQFAHTSGLSVLVDGDPSYGEALGVMHRVRAFEEARAGAIFPEALKTTETRRALAQALPGARPPGQYGGIRRDAVLHRLRVQGYGLSHGDLAGRFAARHQQGQRKRLRRQPRGELCAIIGLHDYASPDASIVETIIPHGMPPRAHELGY